LKPATTPSPAGATATTIGGTWALSVSTDVPEQAEVSITLTLEQQGERVSGSIQGPLGSNPIANASLGAGGEIRFTVPVTIAGQTNEATFNGTVAGNAMRGTVQIVGRTPGSFTGTRPQ
jgi:hypothetical protein